MTAQTAAALAPAAPGGLAEVRLENGATLKARTVILSTGARWRPMNVPGEAEYRNKGVAYCPHCDGPLFKGKRVAVIGGGNSGVEAAIDLAGLASHVTLIEFDPKLRADEVLQAKLRSLRNVAVMTSAQTTEVFGDGAKVVGLAYKDRTTGAPASARPRRDLRPDRPRPQHRMAEGRGEADRARRDRGRCARRNLGLRRVRRRRRDDRAVQADRHRHGRRGQSRALGVRLPDARARADGRGGVDVFSAKDRKGRTRSLRDPWRPLW